MLIHHLACDVGINIARRGLHNHHRQTPPSWLRKNCDTFFTIVVTQHLMSQLIINAISNLCYTSITNNAYDSNNIPLDYICGKHRPLQLYRSP